jgi:hypothetical protein
MICRVCYMFSGEYKGELRKEGRMDGRIGECSAYQAPCPIKTRDLAKEPTNCHSTYGP